ncbi:MULTISPECIES: condensation domain-containing protein [unclassified Streptomyces]|uniref:condensation domain-containing protein n=1 Tax=unclassified Streptomyces TaxID=2593676 RepID=UPI002E2C37B3|nr:condensation domain-containing protein [Streptomyces sp. NBC_00223]
MTAHQVDGPPGAPAQRTVEDLVRRRLRAAARPVLPRADRDRPCALSSGQQQMWVLHRMDPGSPAYLMSWPIRITGPLDGAALRLAWTDMADRHEVLRTRYADAEPGGRDHAVQIVDPVAAPAWHEVDLTRLPPERREERARQVADWVRRRPFDLTSEQPVRVTLIRMDDLLHLMVVTVHHIACDGPGRIGRELGELYGARVGGRPPRLPEPGVQYADFAAWELSGLAQGRLEPHLAYWRAALAGVTELPLPLDRPRPARPDSRGGAVTVVVPPAASDAVRALAAKHRTSPFAVLLTAFHAALGRVAGTDDVTVGLPVGLRSSPELRGTVGYLVNTVVVRARPRPGTSFGALLDEVRGGLLGALDHQSAPFAWVVDDLRPVRTPGVNPLFQAAFDMDEPADGDLFGLPGLTVEQLGLAQETPAKFDVNLHADVLPDGRYAARLEYAAAVIDEATAAAWAECWRSVLEAGVRDPDARPAAGPEDLSVAGPEDLSAAGMAHGPVAGQAPGAPESDLVGAAGPGPAERVAELVTRAWSEVLGVDDPDPDDNFFDLGGDSLRAVALAGLLRGRGLDVAAGDLFAYQSVAELVPAVARRAAVTHVPDPVEPFALIGPEDRAALPADVVDAYPLAAVQLGMLIELRSKPNLTTYQDSTSFLIRDDAPLDAALLGRAAQTVVDRHEVLRTSFDLAGYSVPLQLVHRGAPIAVGVTTVAQGEPEDWLPVLKEFGAAERRTPMDVTRAPLIRVHAHARPDRSRWWLTITECHPILEGWSFHTMLMEILTVYRGLREGRPPEQPDPVPFRYADYIAAEARARDSAEDHAYWRQAVEGCVEPALPVSWQDPPHLAPRRDQYLVDLRDLDAELRRLAEETRTSFKAVMLSAHLTVMRLLGGSEDFFTGLVCDARPETVGADRVLGMYLNTLPFRMPSGAHTWGDLVRAVHDRLTGLWPHRRYPMPLLQKEFGGGDRLLDVFFNYLDFHQVDDTLVENDRTYNDNVNEFGLHVFTVQGVLRINADNHTVAPDAAPVLLALYRLVAEEMALGPDGPVDTVRLRLGADQPEAGRPVRWEGGVPVGPGPVAAAVRRLTGLPAEPSEAASSGAASSGDTASGSGHAAAGVIARVLDADRLPVPRGVPGDLWIDSHRTGAAARTGLDGALEILGPADLDPATEALWPQGSAAVLLRIQELVNRHPSVLDSRVLVRPDAGGTACVTAYVRAARGTEVDVDAVRLGLAGQRLARRFVPRRWAVVEKWPLHPDGTLAVDELPEPAAPAADPDGDASGGRPWDDLFETLLRETLDLAPEGDSVVADRSLADAGLDSFRMVGMLVAIEQAYGVTIPDDLPFTDMFRTPRTLWEAVARFRDGGAG